MVFALPDQSSTAMTDSYTLSDIIKLTGAKPRTIQYWSLNGVIQCDPETQHSGPGSPRRYSEDEVVIAMIINGVARMPLMIGALKNISNKIREMIRYGNKKKFKNLEEADNYVNNLRLEWSELSNAAHKYKETHETKTGPQFSEWYEMKLRATKKEGEKNYAHDWLKFQNAREGVTDKSGGGTALILTVDDAGHWNIQIEWAVNDGGYGGFVDIEPPSSWTLQLHLNLNQTLAPLQLSRVLKT